MRKWY